MAVAHALKQKTQKVIHVVSGIYSAPICSKRVDIKIISQNRSNSIHCIIYLFNLLNFITTSV